MRKKFLKFMFSDFIKKSLLLEGNFRNFFLHVMRKKYLKFMLSDIEILKLFGCIAIKCVLHSDMADVVLVFLRNAVNIHAFMISS